MEDIEWDEPGFWDFFNLDSNALETQIKYPMDPHPPPPPPCFTSDLSLNPPTVPSPDLDQPQAAAPAAAAVGEKEKGEKLIGADEKINKKSGDDEEKKKKGKKEGKAEADKQTRIWAERKRRKKIKDMFQNLHGLMLSNPHGMMRPVPPKADRITIVDEAVNLIKALQQEVEKLGAHKELEKRKRESQDQITAHNDNPVPEFTNSELGGFKAWTCENLNLNSCGDEAQINLCSVNKPGLFPAICCVLEKHNLELISASISSDSNRCMIMMQVSASSNVACSEQVEEIFKASCR